jgi:hypothetical protein
LFIRPVYLGVDGLNAGPFEQTDHKSSSQDLGHHAELARTPCALGTGLNRFSLVVNLKEILYEGKTADNIV